jgi:uncharacterized protein YycO
MNIYRKMIPFFFPAIFLLLAILIGADNYDLLAGQKSVAFTYSENFKQGNVGYGLQSQNDNDISFEQLEPGDIILGGWPGCAYGFYSHAGLYLGNNQVLESYIDTGVTVNSASHFRYYSRACLVRVNVNDRIKQNAIQYALKQRGKMFYPTSFKNDERYWNCSKIIWKAYQRQGINLDANDDLWISPDAFSQNSQVQVIARKGGTPD